jgi:DNA-binding response OmpR family regulator
MSQKSIKAILVIEDNAGDALLLREMLNEQNAQDIVLAHAECMRDAESYLAQHVVDVILLDLGLPDAQGLGGLQRAHVIAPDVPVVVLTGLDDESLAAQTLQKGAQDYLIKGQIDNRGLLRALRYAVERKNLERLKDGFVSSVSHELRTPLTSISGSLALLMVKAAGTLPEPFARLLGIACELPAACTARERHPRHREDGIRARCIQFHARRGSVACRPCHRSQSGIRRELWRNDSASGRACAMRRAG